MSSSISSSSITSLAAGGELAREEAAGEEAREEAGEEAREEAIIAEIGVRKLLCSYCVSRRVSGSSVSSGGLVVVPLFPARLLIPLKCCPIFFSQLHRPRITYSICGRCG